MTEFIWVDNLEDMARAARVLERAWRELNADISVTNHSDLTYELPKSIAVTLYSDKTPWRIGYNEELEAWGLFIDG